MRGNKLKLIVGALAIFIGIGVVWASGLLQSSSLIKSTSSSEDREMQMSEPPVGENFRVQVHFKGFERAKGWIAHFEIVNNTAQPIIYVGHPRKDNFSFCTLAAKRQEQFMKSV